MGGQSSIDMLEYSGEADLAKEEKPSEAAVPTKLEEFQRKYAFGCGECCGNCVRYTAGHTKDLVDLPHGVCSHPDAPEGMVVSCNHHCTEFCLPAVKMRD